jgi:hypothetical protein
MFQHSSSPQPVSGARAPRALFRGPEHDPRVRSVRGGNNGDSGNGGGGAAAAAQGKATWLRSVNPQNDGEVRALLRQVLCTPVDISASLVEQEAPARLAVAQSQTSAFVPRPEAPPYVPRKTGVDRATQIEPEDHLFDFDREVEPLLDVLVSKTLEQSLLEVNREKELAHLHTNKSYYGDVKARLRAEQEARERAAVAHQRDKEERMRREQARLQRELLACEKAAAVSQFKVLVGDGLQQQAIKHLEEVEHFPNELRDAIVKDFLPWLGAQVDARLDRRTLAAQLTDALISNALARRRQGALAYHRAIADRKVAESRAALEAEARRAAAAADKERKALERRSRVCVVLRGALSQGIPLSKLDTLAEAEVKIAMWLAVNDESVPKPQHGYLELALRSGAPAQELADKTRLLGSLQLYVDEAHAAAAAAAEEEEEAAAT